MAPEIKLTPVRRLIKKAGAERVSADAAEALRDILERLAKQIAGEAVSAAKHAGRKTVKEADIEMAAKIILEKAGIRI